MSDLYLKIIAYSEENKYDLIVKKAAIIGFWGLMRLRKNDKKMRTWQLQFISKCCLSIDKGLFNGLKKMYDNFSDK